MLSQVCEGLNFLSVFAQRSREVSVALDVC